MGRNSLDGPRLALLVVTLVVQVEVQKFTTTRIRSSRVRAPAA
jgi:hypothetical protein